MWRMRGKMRGVMVVMVVENMELMMENIEVMMILLMAVMVVMGSDH